MHLACVTKRRWLIQGYRCASIAVPKIQHGPPFLSAFTFASTAPRTTAILVSTYPSFDLQTSIVRNAKLQRGYPLTDCIEWQWDQLRTMKVGGNESATKYFQTHGGTAALASKDAKTKYTSNAASKYKDELKRRAAADVLEYGQILPPSGCH